MSHQTESNTRSPTLCCFTVNNTVYWFSVLARYNKVSCCRLIDWLMACCVVGWLIDCVVAWLIVCSVAWSGSSCWSGLCCWSDLRCCSEHTADLLLNWLKSSSKPNLKPKLGLWPTSLFPLGPNPSGNTSSAAQESDSSLQAVQQRKPICTPWQYHSTILH